MGFDMFRISIRKIQLFIRASRIAFAPPCLALSACVASSPINPNAPQTGVQIGYTADAAPLIRRTGETAPGCWALDYEAALTETITQDVQVQAERRDRSGKVTAPSVWRSETTTNIITPRKTLNFETPCENMLTESFLAALQHALQDRGLYEGKINARLDQTTRNAIRAYQQQSGGLNSAYLSLESAHALGLIEVPQAEDLESAMSDPDADPNSVSEEE